jgi:hypothetical protein
VKSFASLEWTCISSKNAFDISLLASSIISLLSRFSVITAPSMFF